MNRCIYFILVLLIYGCSQMEYPQRTGLFQLNENPSLIDGVYKNTITDSTPYETIWNELGYHSNFKFDTTFSIPNSSVKLTARNRKRILAQLYVDTSLIGQKLIKGKLKGRYFVARRKLKFVGFPFTYWMYDDHKFQLAKDSSGRLLLDGVRAGGGWIVVFGTNTHHTYGFTFDPR